MPRPSSHQARRCRAHALESNENSLEHERWLNGAFTQVFLDALGQDADRDLNGVVSMTELTRYVIAGVPRPVHEVDPARQQNPGIEMRFEHTIFATGL